MIAEPTHLSDYAQRWTPDDDELGLDVPAAAERPQPARRSDVDPSSALEDRYIVDGLIRHGSLVVLAAAEGVGKSYAKTETCIRLTTGHGALFNHYRIPDPVRVLSIDVENGDEEETRREEEVLARLGIARTDLVDLWGVSLEGLALGDAGDQAYIADAIARILPEVVFLDTGSSMVGDEWGAELKAAIRFLRGLARTFGCAIVVLVHLVKPAKAPAGSKGRNAKPDSQGQHGTSLADVMGQWTRQADVVAMMAPAGAERILWTVRKRVPHSQLVLKAEGGTFDVIQVVAGEDLGVGTAERIHGCIATGQADAASIATYLDIAERTVWRHVAKLREAGRIAPDTPLRLVEPVSPTVSRPVSPSPSTKPAPPTPVVSDMSVEPTDTVTTTVGSDVVSVSVDGPTSEDTVRCSDYAAHKDQHHWIIDRWVCLACEPERLL